jgi:hypothetical protein
VTQEPDGPRTDPAVEVTTAPFSSVMVSKKDLDTDQNKLWKSFSLIVRIIYFPFGLFLAIATLFQIAGLFITSLGSRGLSYLQNRWAYFNPGNKKCFTRAVKEAMESRKAR